MDGDDRHAGCERGSAPRCRGGDRDHHPQPPRQAATRSTMRCAPFLIETLEAVERARRCPGRAAHGRGQRLLRGRRHRRHEGAARCARRSGRHQRLEAAEVHAPRHRDHPRSREADDRGRQRRGLGARLRPGAGLRLRDGGARGELRHGLPQAGPHPGRGRALLPAAPRRAVARQGARLFLPARCRRTRRLAIGARRPHGEGRSPRRGARLGGRVRGRIDDRDGTREVESSTARSTFRPSRCSPSDRRRRRSATRRTSTAIPFARFSTREAGK